MILCVSQFYHENAEGVRKTVQVHTFHNLTPSGERFLASSSRKTTINGSRRTIQAGKRQVVIKFLLR